MGHYIYTSYFKNNACGNPLLLSVASHITSRSIVLIGLLQTLLFASISFADTTLSNAPDIEIQEIAVSELVQILEVETEIATKTRLNVDYVPGMVTVLNGNELQALGVRTVWEALSLVPGFQKAFESTGSREISVRGLEHTFASGAIKLLVNGVAMNSTISANATSVQKIPIAQIERIEVIRGPGAAIHGEYAYSAVVDVITRAETSSVFGAVEEYDTYRAGGLYSWADPDRDMKLSINASAMKSDGADVNSGLDKLHAMGMGSISNSPGPTNEDLESQFLFFNFGYKDLTFSTQYFYHGFGDHFGSNNVLPFDEDRIAIKNDNLALELKQALHITSELDGMVKIGWMEYTLDSDNLLLNPPGFAGIYTDGMIASPYYEEQRINFSVGFTYLGMANHKMFTEWSIADISMGDVWQESNFVPSTLAPLPSMQRFTGAENFIEEDQSRTVNSLVLQDEYTPANNKSITLGLRYDHYDDIGDSFTPRLAAVWRVNRKNTLKAQYSSAFRPPNFLEMYTKNNPVLTGNRDIKAQTSDNYELGYIYRIEKQTYRVTLFRSDLDDVIVIENGMYTNSGGARLQGFELETEQAINRELKLNANFSFTDTKDIDTGGKIPNVSDWLANIGLIYEPIRDLIFSIQYQCVCGDYGRAPNDTRNKLDGYQTFDLTANSYNTWYRGLTIRAGVKNLFDDEIKYPSQPDTYPDDYPRPGRYWWMEVSKEF